MAARIRNPFRHEPRHRAGQDAPDGCLSHLHPGELMLPVWRTGRFGAAS